MVRKRTIISPRWFVDEPEPEPCGSWWFWFASFLAGGGSSPEPGFEPVKIRLVGRPSLDCAISCVLKSDLKVISVDFRDFDVEAQPVWFEPWFWFRHFFAVFAVVLVLTQFNSIGSPANQNQNHLARGGSGSGSVPKKVVLVRTRTIPEPVVLVLGKL